MIFIGIDPGLTGSFPAIDSDTLSYNSAKTWQSYGMLSRCCNMSSGDVEQS
jgi:hypothetical protein